MAQTRERPASRGGSGGTKSSKRNSANGSRSRAQGKSRASKSSGSRQKATSASANGAQRSKPQSGGGANGVLNVAKQAAVPMATGVAGAVAGVVLGRRNRKPRKILGVPIPGSRDGLSGLAKEVRKAGQQFGHLANEVQTTRKKAEDVGKAIS